MSEKNDSRYTEAYRSLERQICTERMEHERFIELAEDEIHSHPNADTSELQNSIADARAALEQLEADRENCVLVRWAQKNGCETRAFSELESRRTEICSQLDGDFFDRHVHGDNRQSTTPAAGVRTSFRADVKPAKRYLSGYASIYNQTADVGGLFDEEMRTGAFRDVLESDDLDCVCQANHDANYPFGRTTAGTLKLRDDPHGLYFECPLNLDDADAQAAAARVGDGTWSGCSICFIVGDDLWDYSTAIPKRTITKVARLYDVGPVTFPCYVGTSVAIRSDTGQMRNGFLWWPEKKRVTTPESTRQRVYDTYNRLKQYLPVAASSN